MRYDRSWLDQVLKEMQDDPEYQLNARFLNQRFTLDFGESRFTVGFDEGVVVEVVEGPGLLVESAFSLAGDSEIWDRIFQPSPPPRYHHFIAALAQGGLRFDGSWTALLRVMGSLNKFMETARTLNGPIERPADPVIPETYQTVGRYVNVRVGEALHKVFYLEAGQGIPVVCQHTAGTDATQWRYLMEDRELTKRFRFIAYDLPNHGKSEPPLTGAYWTRSEGLTKDWIVEFVPAFGLALGLDRPIFLGCSIGGVIAHLLAAEVPDDFRGFIGMAGTSPTSGFHDDWQIDPNINSYVSLDAMADSIIAPNIPERNRRLARWLQSVSDPRTMRDDLHLWSAENTDADLVTKIDTAKTKLYAFAGEYDYTCPPEYVQANCDRIGPGVHFDVLKGLGHFPMTEDYELLRPYLVTALEGIMEGR